MNDNREDTPVSTDITKPNAPRSTRSQTVVTEDSDASAAVQRGLSLGTGPNGLGDYDPQKGASDYDYIEDDEFGEEA